MDPAARKVAHALDMEAATQARELVQAHVRIYATILNMLRDNPETSNLDSEELGKAASTIYIGVTRRNGR